MIKIEHQQRHRLPALALHGTEASRVFQKGAPVEQPGQRIGRCRVTVNMNVVVLHHQHDDERRADGVDHRFQRKDVNPAFCRAMRQKGPHDHR